MEATGLAKPTIYKKMAQTPPAFPVGTKPAGFRVRVWWADEVEAWQKGQWKAAEVAA
jgi:predicted DNA-binding transcriptional regulator AlpA